MGDVNSNGQRAEQIDAVQSTKEQDVMNEEDEQRCCLLPSCVEQSLNCGVCAHMLVPIIYFLYNKKIRILKNAGVV